MASAALARKPTISRRQLRGWMTGYLFVSPVILGLLIFTLGPMIMSLYYSFTKYNLLSSPHWIGLGNYRRVLDDREFLTSLRVTFRYALVSVPLGLILSGLLALLLHRPLRGMSLFRALFYIPVIVPPVAAAILFADLYNVRYGIANRILRGIGLHGYSWITRPETALNALVVMSFWSIGGGTIVWLAGLQGIPRSLYEAAEIDGAGGLRRFWNITIPMMTPIIFFNLVLGVIGSLQVFTQALVMTNGGPANSTLFVALKIYREGFQHFNMGYAATIAWVLFLIISALTALIFKTSGWVYYEGAQR